MVVVLSIIHEGHQDNVHPLPSTLANSVPCLYLGGGEGGDLVCVLPKAF